MGLRDNSQIRIADHTRAIQGCGKTEHFKGMRCKLNRIGILSRAGCDWVQGCAWCTVGSWSAHTARLPRLARQIIPERRYTASRAGCTGMASRDLASWIGGDATEAISGDAPRHLVFSTCSTKFQKYPPPPGASIQRKMLGVFRRERTSRQCCSHASINLLQAR